MIRSCVVHKFKFCSVAVIAAGLALSACEPVEDGAGTAQTNAAFDSELRQNGHKFGAYRLGDVYTINGVSYQPVENLAYVEEGNASWYGIGLEGNVTTNGESFDPTKMTAAHRTLPFSTVVKITNLDNNLSTFVRINDRGPFISNRLIDLSQAAAAILGFADKASARVKIEVDQQRTRQVASKAGGTIGQLATGTAAANNAYRPLVSANTPITDRSYTATKLTPSQTTTRVQNYASPSKVPSNKPLSLIPGTSPSTTPTIVATPTPSPTSVTPSQTLPSRVGGSGFFIQAGSFSDPVNAEQLRSRLSSLGQVGVEQANANGKSVQRVMVGPMGTQKEAQLMLGRVIGAGSYDARIVKR
jgi:rare lipoprotein A